jgi:hypothetical protein
MELVAGVKLAADFTDKRRSDPRSFAKSAAHSQGWLGEGQVDHYGCVVGDAFFDRFV